MNILPYRKSLTVRVSRQVWNREPNEPAQPLQPTHCFCVSLSILLSHSS